jgi:hypothetical protein
MAQVIYKVLLSRFGQDRPLTVLPGLDDLDEAVELDANPDQGHARKPALRHKTTGLVYEHPAAVVAQSAPVYLRRFEGYAAGGLDGVHEEPAQEHRCIFFANTGF